MGDLQGQTESLFPDSYQSLVHSPPLSATSHNQNHRTPIANTSSTSLAAGRPALESPFIGVRLFQEHIIAPDEGQQVLVDDILVGQATSGLTLSRGENLKGRHKGGSTRPEMEVESAGAPRKAATVPSCRTGFQIVLWGLQLRHDPHCVIHPIKMFDPVPSWGRRNIHKLSLPRLSICYVCTEPYSSNTRAMSRPLSHRPISKGDAQWPKSLNIQTVWLQPGCQ